MNEEVSRDMTGEAEWTGHLQKLIILTGLNEEIIVDRCLQIFLINIV